MEVLNVKRISQGDIGLFLKLVKYDNPNLSNKEYASIISEEFNVICYESDILRYESLHIELEDYEKLSRMNNYGNLEHLIE